MPNKIKFVPAGAEKVWFKNLQKAREDKGMTQIKLALEAEVSQQSITYYESGTRVPSLDVAQRIAKVLNCSIDYLIGNDDSMIESYYKLSDKDKDAVIMVIDGLSNKNNN